MHSLYPLLNCENTNSQDVHQGRKRLEDSTLRKLRKKRETPPSPKKWWILNNNAIAQPVLLMPFISFQHITLRYIQGAKDPQTVLEDSN
jgi:hypothetical protein